MKSVCHPVRGSLKPRPPLESVVTGFILPRKILRLFFYRIATKAKKNDLKRMKTETPDSKEGRGFKEPLTGWHTDFMAQNLRGN